MQIMNSKDLAPVEGVKLHAVELSQRDPLRRRVLASSRSAVFWGFITCLIFNGLRALAALIDGNFQTHDDILGFIRDPSVYTNFGFGWVIFSYYIWVPSGLAKVFNGLSDNRILTGRTNNMFPLASDDGLVPDPHFPNRLERIKGSFNARWHVVVNTLIFIAVFFGTAIIYRSMGDRAWYTEGFYARIICQLWAGTLVTCIAALILSCGTLIHQLRQVFKETTPNVRPLHPDGVGGLSPLGGFALRLVYFISIVGIMLLAITPYTRGLAEFGAFQYSLSFDLIIAALVYAFAAPTVFFLILGTGSGPMRRAKIKILGIIGERFDQEYLRSLKAVHDPAIDDIKSPIEQLGALHKLYKTTRDFPIWPFDGASVRKFTSSYLAPLATGLLIEVVLRLIKSTN